MRSIVLVEREWFHGWRSFQKGVVLVRSRSRRMACREGVMSEAATGGHYRA